MNVRRSSWLTTSRISCAKAREALASGQLSQLDYDALVQRLLIASMLTDASKVMTQEAYASLAAEIGEPAVFEAASIMLYGYATVAEAEVELGRLRRENRAFAAVFSSFMADRIK